MHQVPRMFKFSSICSPKLDKSALAQILVTRMEVTCQSPAGRAAFGKAGTANASPKVLAALKSLTGKPIRYILDTRYADDHTGGNDNLRRAGVTIT